MSAETSTVDLSKEGGAAAEDAAQEDANKEGSTAAKAGKPLSESEAQDFCQWLQVTLGSKKVSEVKVTKRLSDSPAIVTDHESGALRRMMKMVVSGESVLWNVIFLQ
jgi:TNF receptor-associated protein 1